MEEFLSDLLFPLTPTQEEIVDAYEAWLNA